MKKILSLTLFIIVIINVFSANAQTPQHHVDGKVTAAEVPIENFDLFYQFVETGEPNIYDITNACYTYELTYTDDGQEAIKELSASSPQFDYHIKGEMGGTWSFGHHMVAGLRDFETFNYFVHTVNIKELLTKSGIDCIINDYLILSLSPYFPPFIWANTNHGNYYIILEQTNLNNLDIEWDIRSSFTYEVYDTHTMLKTKNAILEKSKTPPINIFINLELVEFDTPPIMKDDRILVPVRALCEKMKATVDWEESTQTVTVRHEDTTVVLTVGNKIAWVNGKKQELDVVPEITNNRTLVSLRFIGESLGYLVNWVSDDLVTLYSNYDKDTISN